MNIVDKIIDATGGVCALAEKIGLHHSSIISWRKTGKVPVKRLLDIEAVSGIPREEICPELFGLNRLAPKKNSGEAA